MSCEANPIHPPIHAAVTWLLWLILIARGPGEAITGPFTSLTRRITTSIPALKSFCLLIYWSICDDPAVNLNAADALLLSGLSAAVVNSVLAAVQRQFLP